MRCIYIRGAVYFYGERSANVQHGCAAPPGSNLEGPGECTRDPAVLPTSTTDLQLLSSSSGLQMPSELKLREAASREAELEERNGALEQAATKYKSHERATKDIQARIESAEARARAESSN